MESATPQKQAHTRPTFLLLLFLMFVVTENVARAGLSVQQAVQLPLLPAYPSPLYVAASSVIWVAAFSLSIFGLLRLNPWAPPLTIAVAVLYQAWLWVTRLVFEKATEASATLGFRIFLSAAFLGGIVGILALPSTRRLFSEARIYLEYIRNADGQPLRQDPTTHLQ